MIAIVGSYKIASDDSKWGLLVGCLQRKLNKSKTTNILGRWSHVTRPMNLQSENAYRIKSVNAILKKNSQDIFCVRNRYCLLKKCM